MLNQNKKFYITTAIDYVNAPPHCGHALEKIQADVIARYHRLLGEEVLFLTGTDENSLKNVQAAHKERIPIKELVDKNAQRFYELKEILNLSNNDFIRTTENRHIKGAQKLWLACKKDIYRKTYRGLYCVGCEEFYKEKELEDGLCPEHKTKPELIEEENYFFKLSKYQNQIKKLIEKDEMKIIPETRKNEVLSFINQGLEDICISRSAERAQGWGIDVPGDKTQKIWVWFDALSNYINAVGYADDEKKFKKWWPADIHVIGKGILRFHAIYWPAILISAGLEAKLPRKIFVHGYLTCGDQKMSKSLGNVIDPFELVEKYGTDAVRYFLLREIPSTEDGDFTYEKFEKRYNGDLANGLGNLVSRILTLTQNFDNKIPLVNISKTGESIFFSSIKTYHDGWKSSSVDLWELYNKYLNKFEFNKVLSLVFGISIDEKTKYSEPGWLPGLNRYIDYSVLWDLVKRDKEQSGTIIYDILESLRHIAWMLSPFLPTTADKIFEQLGLNLKEEKNRSLEEAKKWGGLEPGTKIKKGEPLFPKLK